jgi:hypothetical protein
MFFGYFFKVIFIAQFILVLVSTRQCASIASMYAMPLVGSSNHEMYLVIISLDIDIFGCSKVDVQLLGAHFG